VTFKCYASSVEVFLNIRVKGAVLNSADSEEVSCGEVRLGDEKDVNVVIK
jgi:hypothetical protein